MEIFTLAMRHNGPVDHETGQFALSCNVDSSKPSPFSQQKKMSEVELPHLDEEKAPATAEAEAVQPEPAEPSVVQSEPAESEAVRSEPCPTEVRIFSRDRNEIYLHDSDESFFI